MPASIAAQNGWMKTFVLTRAKPRRRKAPAPALTNISARGAGPRREREQPGRRRRRLRDRADRLHCGFRSQPAELDILCRPHRGGDAIHIYASRISLDDKRAVLVVGLELQLTPARNNARAQAKRASETLGRGHHLIRSLSVYEQRPREGEDKIAAFIGRHGSFSPRNAFAGLCSGRSRPERFAPAPSG